MNRYATINTNPGNLPFARPISEGEFQKLVDFDKRLFGDAIIYMDDDMYLHVPFTGVRHAIMENIDFEFPLMSDEERQDFIYKFKNAIMGNDNSSRPV